MYKPSILYEDNHLLIVNKQPGDLTQKDHTGDPCITDHLREYLKKRDSKPGSVFLGHPHRLDRPCSGILVMAKTSKTLSRMAAFFREGLPKKTYWAILESVPDPPEGELIHFLRKDTRINRSWSVSPQTPKAKEARLTYRCIHSAKKNFLLEVELLTGRHHQIRAQLSTIGCPIKGDTKYGAEEKYQDGSIFLHSRRIVFDHPVGGKTMDILAPPPEDEIWAAFQNGTG